MFPYLYWDVLFTIRFSHKVSGFVNMNDEDAGTEKLDADMKAIGNS